MSKMWWSSKEFDFMPSKYKKLFHPSQACMSSESMIVTASHLKRSETGFDIWFCCPRCTEHGHECYHNVPMFEPCTLTSYTCNHGNTKQFMYVLIPAETPVSPC